MDYILIKLLKNKQKTALILKVSDSFMSKWTRKILFEGSHSKFQKESQAFQPASQTAGTHDGALWWGSFNGAGPDPASCGLTTVPGLLGWGWGALEKTRLKIRTAGRKYRLTEIRNTRQPTKANLVAYSGFGPIFLFPIQRKKEICCWLGICKK